MPRLLLVGDLHLGRRPSRLPADLDELGLRAADLGPAAAWRAAVDLALSEQVDAVVLAGDVVESLDDRFAAYGHLEQGVARLAEAGLPVLGVAGNHDVRALPRLAARLAGFRLLGPGGTWEHVDLAGADGGRVRLLGWSFPAPRFDGDPLQGLSVRPEAGLPVVGVLHADLDGPPGGPYASVRRTALLEAPVDAWLLGHVHRPDALDRPRPVGYLGSLVGLDPGEPGPHGPWLVEVAGPGEVTATQVPLAPLRYESETVDLAGLDLDGDAEAALEGAVLAALGRVAARVGPTGRAGTGAPKLAAARLILTGRTARHLAVHEALAGGALAELRRHDGGCTIYVEKLVDRSAAALDLEALARADHPPGRLARRLLALEQDGPEAEALVRAAAPRLRRAAADPAFAALGADPPDDSAIRAQLLAAGREALERLLAEAEGEPR